MDIIHYYKEQEHPGWCGVASIQMALLAAEIYISQKEIADYVLKDWWGTPSELMLAYLSKYFKLVNFKTNASISDISYHLKKNHIVIVNWWDDIDNDDYDNGHYSLAINYDNKNKMITLADPSQGRGIWNMPIKEFKKRWFDTLDTNNRVYLEGLMFWIDLKSKIL